MPTKEQNFSTIRNIRGERCEKVAARGKIWYNGDMEQNEAEKLLTSGKTGEKFGLFYDLLLFYNEKFNLTRITDREECYKKHFSTA